MNYNSRFTGEEIDDAIAKIPDYENLVFVNAANKIKNPEFTDTSLWTFGVGSHSFESTGFPANNLVSMNEGQGSTVRQFQSIDGWQSGYYYASVTWAENNRGTMYVRGYKPDYSGTILCAITYDTPESDKVFTIDTSVYNQISVDFEQGYIDTIKLTQPVLFKVDGVGSTIPTFYNVPWERVFNASSDVENDIVNPLEGKIISANGDSIAEGYTSSGGYVRQIAERNNMTWQNIAVSGGVIVPREGKYSIVDGVQNMRADADYVLLEGGVNDTYALNNDIITLGEVGTTYASTYSTDTYCDAFQKMIIDVYARFPTKKIIYISVHNHGNWKEGNPIYDASIAMCKKWGIPICNLTENTAPLGRIDAIKALYTNNGDGQHPNGEGYEIFYTPKIESALRAL